MKKVICIIVCLAMLLSINMVCSAIEIVSVNINGAQVDFGQDVPAQIIGNRTMVPARIVFEQLGYKVSWDGKLKTVTIKSDNQTLILTQDSQTLQYNGETSKQKLDTVAQNVNNRILIPLRIPAELLGFKVYWNGEKKIVTIVNENNVISNAQRLYDVVEKNGGVSFLRTEIENDIQYRKGFKDNYKIFSKNSKILEIEGFAVDAACTIGAIIAGNVGAVDAAVSGVNAITENQFKQTIQTQEDFIYYLATLSGEKTKSDFALLHINTKRNSMNVEEARKYITYYYSSKINSATLLMGWAYFSSKNPTNILDKLKMATGVAANSVFNTLVGELAGDVCSFVTGNTIELLETVKKMGDENITRWADSVQTYRNQLKEALQ